MDRAIPLILPFFIKVRGEIHHPHRYERRRTFLALGTLPESDPEAERIFRDLVFRNAINFGSAATATEILRESSSDAEIKTGVVDLFAAAEIA